MRHPRLMIGLFLLATVLVDLAVADGNLFTPGPNLEVAVFCLFFSQVTMIAIWLGLGHTAAPSRAVIAFFLLIECNVVLYWATRDSELFGIETLFCGMITGAVAVPLLVARLFGLRLARTVWR